MIYRAVLQLRRDDTYEFFRTLVKADSDAQAHTKAAIERYRAFPLEDGWTTFQTRLTPIAEQALEQKRAQEDRTPSGTVSEVLDALRTPSTELTTLNTESGVPEAQPPQIFGYTILAKGEVEDSLYAGFVYATHPGAAEQAAERVWRESELSEIYDDFGIVAKFLGFGGVGTSVPNEVAKELLRDRFNLRRDLPVKWDLWNFLQGGA